MVALNVDAESRTWSNRLACGLALLLAAGMLGLGCHKAPPDPSGLSAKERAFFESRALDILARLSPFLAASVEQSTVDIKGCTSTESGFCLVSVWVGGRKRGPDVDQTHTCYLAFSRRYRNVMEINNELWWTVPEIVDDVGVDAARKAAEGIQEAVGGFPTGMKLVLKDADPAHAGRYDFRWERFNRHGVSYEDSWILVSITGAGKLGSYVASETIPECEDMPRLDKASAREIAERVRRADAKSRSGERIGIRFPSGEVKGLCYRPASVNVVIDQPWRVKARDILAVQTESGLFEWPEGVTSATALPSDPEEGSSRVLLLVQYTGYLRGSRRALLRFLPDYIAVDAITGKVYYVPDRLRAVCESKTNAPAK